MTTVTASLIDRGLEDYMLETAILKVYTTEGVKGPFVSEDDKATLIVAGFWEEYFDLPTMWAKIQDIVIRKPNP